MKILFVYYHKYPEYWKDGLYEAIELLSKKHYVTKINLAKQLNGVNTLNYDFVLGWGAFGSPADLFLQGMIEKNKGLCLAGNATPVPIYANNYKIIFYETDWVKNNYLKGLDTKLVKAFGINTKIYKKLSPSLPKLYNWLSVGAFSYWKHLDKMKDKAGEKLVIGEIQKDNLSESLDIANDLLTNDIAVSGMISPKKLNMLYNLSNSVYVPADINGGGERTVLEARNCGCIVEIEDNPKLDELLNCKIPTEVDYFNSLNTAINESCL